MNTTTVAVCGALVLLLPLTGALINALAGPRLPRRAVNLIGTGSILAAFLVAAPDCPDDVVTALKTALLGFGAAPACEDLRERLCLAAFVPVVAEDYDLTTRWDAEARAKGYAQPG